MRRRQQLQRWMALQRERALTLMSLRDLNGEIEDYAARTARPAA